MEEENKKEYFPSSRIESLTDGIFAFAMTLLVLNLNAPELYGIVTNDELYAKLYAMSDRFIIFLISFFLLASAWGIHHRQFARINRADTTLMWINMIRLLFVIMIPFSSVLVGSYDSLSVAVLFFDLNILALCVVSFIEWKYAVRNDLTEKIPREANRRGDVKNIIPISVAAVACGIALFNPDLSLWTFATIPLFLLGLKKLGKIS